MTATADAPLFANSALAITPSYPNYYGYDRPSPLLFNFGRALQCVVSQAGTFLLTGKFHDRDCAIHKCEGGCVIAGVGELVLSNRSCYFDTYGWMGEGKKKLDRDAAADKMAKFITDLVLNWDPMDPVDSLIRNAAILVGCSEPELIHALENGRDGGPFSGNALSDFFNWNPFSEAPIAEDYERWCWVNVHKQPEAEIVEQQADRHLGKELLEGMNSMIREVLGDSRKFVHRPMCCSPRRLKSKDGDEKVLRFWVNTGCDTQIDGWKSQEEIEAFIVARKMPYDRRRDGADEEAFQAQFV